MDTKSIAFPSMFLIGCFFFLLFFFSSTRFLFSVCFVLSFHDGGFLSNVCFLWAICSQMTFKCLYELWPEKQKTKLKKMLNDERIKNNIHVGRILCKVITVTYELYRKIFQHLKKGRETQHLNKEQIIGCNLRGFKWGSQLQIRQKSIGVLAQEHPL